jgi:hypothetical protein
MSLLKKCLVKNRLSVNRDKRRHPFRPLRQAGRDHSSKIKPDKLLVGKLSFVEDFTREHSFPVSHIAPIEMSGTF